ncbi:hypothetical protein ACFUMH_02120 [Cellulomonas sp. NPDC057328]|uniref:hypothetical protein n=1 Tax=Cellulomonas sp. NPDC057328 TaxID=3346101 RepID=UPI0036373F2B
MTTHPTPDITADRDERSRKKAAVVRYSLAGVALLGVGAALTSAAWTDDAWFQGEASAVAQDDIELQGGLSEAALVDADDLSNAVDISVDPNQLANFVPGETRVVTLYLKNDGVVPLDVTGAPVLEGALFEGAEPVDVSLAADGVVGVLDPAEVTTVDLTLAAPAWDDEDVAYKGATGALTVTFTGATTTAAAN